MTILGLPTSMFLIFALTIVAGSLGAIHYTIVHIILKRPFGDEVMRQERRDARARAAADADSETTRGGDRG